MIPHVLQLSHKSLKVYKLVRQLVQEVYKISLLLPYEERFCMTQQIRRAALSTKLNLSEGSSRQSLKERIRFYEIARGSLVEVDSILETAMDLNYLNIQNVEHMRNLINGAFAMISRMISGTNLQQGSMVTSE